MNVIFLTLSNINSISERMIYTDLLREFIQNNHNVYIVSPSERKNKKPTHIIDEGNCKILKVKVGNIQKTNVIEKGISTVLLENNFKSAIRRYLFNIHFDLILYATPPITIVVLSETLKVFI